MRAARSSGEQDHWVPIIDPSADTDTTATDRSLPSRAKLQMLLQHLDHGGDVGIGGRVLHGTEADRPTLWIGFDLAHGPATESYAKRLAARP